MTSWHDYNDIVVDRVRKLVWDEKTGMRTRLEDGGGDGLNENGVQGKQTMHSMTVFLIYRSIESHRISSRSVLPPSFRNPTTCIRVSYSVPIQPSICSGKPSRPSRPSKAKQGQARPSHKQPRSRNSKPSRLHSKNSLWFFWLSFQSRFYPTVRENQSAAIYNCWMQAAGYLLQKIPRARILSCRV